MVYEWEAVLGGGGQGDGSSAFIAFPWDPKECFGKANLVPVFVDFEGEPYRGDIANMGGGPCIVMLKRIREKLGKTPGDTVKVRLWHDTQPRVVDPPEDLAKPLEANPAARDFWNGLSPGNRRLYVGWIEGAKKPETRKSRVEKTVAKLALGQKFS